MPNINARKHKNRPRRHSRARARLLLRIDTTVLRLTSRLDELRAIRWDVDHGRDMRTPKARAAALDDQALREQLTKIKADNGSLRARLIVVESELDELYECMERDHYDPEQCRGGK